jgi:hypothetical protein
MCVAHLARTSEFSKKQHAQGPLSELIFQEFKQIEGLLLRMFPSNRGYLKRKGP